MKGKITCYLKVHHDIQWNLRQRTRFISCQPTCKIHFMKRMFERSVKYALCPSLNCERQMPFLTSSKDSISFTRPSRLPFNFDLLNEWNVSVWGSWWGRLRPSYDSDGPRDTLVVRTKCGMGPLACPWHAIRWYPDRVASLARGHHSCSALRPGSMQRLFLLILDYQVTTPRIPTSGLDRLWDKEIQSTKRLPHTCERQTLDFVTNNIDTTEQLRMVCYWLRPWKIQEIARLFFLT